LAGQKRLRPRPDVVHDLRQRQLDRAGTRAVFRQSGRLPSEDGRPIDAKARGKNVRAFPKQIAKSFQIRLLVHDFCHTRKKPEMQQIVLTLPKTAKNLVESRTGKWLTTPKLTRLI
jgi:hypothetical protein